MLAVVMCCFIETQDVLPVYGIDMLFGVDDSDTDEEYQETEPGVHPGYFYFCHFCEEYHWEDLDEFEYD